MRKEYVITDERSVVGSFKADGANDDDSIYVARKAMLAGNKGRMVMAIVLWVMGFVPACIAIFMLVIGEFPYMSGLLTVLFVGGGVMCFKSYRKVKNAIESGTKRHCESLNIPVVV